MSVTVSSEMPMLGDLYRFSGAGQQFWPLFLDTVGTSLRARRVLLLNKKAGQWQAVQQWPVQLAGEPHDAALARQGAEQVMTASASLQLPAPGGIAAVIRLDMAALDTTSEPWVLVAFVPADGLQHETLALLLPLIAAIPAHYMLGRETRHRQTDVERLYDTLHLAIRLGNESRFLKTAMLLCNELAVRFGCERISLGWLDGPYIKLAAVSHIEKFDRKMAAAQQLESVMEEAFDQDEEIVFPAPEGSHQVVRTHDLYARTQGVGYVASIPLRVANQPEAVVTAERLAKPFTEADVWELRLICDACTGRLSALRESDRWWGAKWLARWREILDKLWGVENSLWKFSGVLSLLTVAMLALIDWNYRIDTTFTLRARDLIFMPAPFDGYLKSVHVQLGDAVESGQSLASLDTSELVLEDAMNVADVQRYQREAEKAQATGQLADMQIALARQRQSLAKLQLVRHHLANAEVKAPMKGVVVEGELEKNLGAPLRKGDVLLKVARLEDTYVELEIDQVDVHDVKQGSTGEFAFVGRPELRFPLVIERIDPVATTKDGKNSFLARARITTDIASWWRPGMGGTAKIEAGERSLLWIMTHRTVRFLRKVLWW